MPPKKVIKWSEDITINEGVQLLGGTIARKAVAVDSNIYMIMPEWGPTHTQKQEDNIVTALNGRIVYVEVEVQYRLTGRTCEVKDYGR